MSTGAEQEVAPRRDAFGRTAAEAAALARLYDVDMVDEPGDLDLYRALAARTEGPILELAVGTGRLAVELALHGRRVTGVDIDPAMLDRARDRARRAGVAERALALVEADMRDVTLPEAGSFGFGFVALNSLLVLGDRDAQRATVATLAHHLGPGGIAAVDVWLPDADDLARFDGRVILEYPRQDPETGRLVVKVGSALHDPSRQIVSLTTIYEEGEPGRPADRWVRQDRLRLVSVDELLSFAEDAGLVVETIAGTYDLDSVGPTSDRAILVARMP
jgi:SAM-dependent methyltransferase